ncbi:MAG: hypothetical protein SCARUB_03162 [Candidatus Scalindua rubra]|uniref:DUF4340 domain-containing protein n=1 Tax=Candidatus Scalindua rubra TaxID=1872076 RepID=A0A1E3X7W8_9BACT|nr:MAG: hypothetical protein SCARUB_03162 [Candidatus Scalindua rubra]
MKFKTTIILLIIALIGVAYIFLYEKKQYRTEEWIQRQQMVLPDYKVNQINKIDIIKENDTLILENIDEERWKMLQPLQLRADKAEVTDILSQFEFLRKIGTLKESEIENFNLKDYGLDKPQTVVNLWKRKLSTLKDTEETTSTEPKYTINIGDKIAAGQDTVYINVEGNNDVFVVTGTLLEKINKDIIELRNKWVFEFDKDAIERVKIQSDSKEPIVCSREEQLWWMTQPISDRADSERIRDILNELKNLKIAKNDFVSDDVEDIPKHGLDKPVLTVSIGYKDEVQTVHLGHTLDDKVYTKRDDESSIFFVHDVLLRDLDLEANDLRDKQLLRFDSIGTYGIEKVELKYPDTTLTMEKTKQYDWMIKSPTEILADRDTVREFVEKIKDLQIQEYVDDSGENYDKYGLGDSPIEVSVFRKIGEGETVKFMIGKTDEDGGLCYVRRAGEKAIYSVPTENFHDVAVGGFIAFRDKLVLEFPKENTQEIVIDRDGKTFVCQKKEGPVQKWNLTSPVNVEADIDAVNQVVWNLSFLKVGKIVTLSAEDLSEYGLDNPSLKVSVTYEESGSTEGGDEVIGEKEDLIKPKEKITKTLLVGGKLEPEKDKSSYFAKLADEDIIFQIGWPDVRDYSVELATKTLFDFDISQTKSLKIKHPEKELSFQRNEDNKWEMIQPENKLLEGNFADRIISAMNALRAESVVQYSIDNLSEFELDNPQFSVTISSDEGENSLLVGKKTKSDFFVMNKTLNFVYLVRKNKIEDIIKESVSSEIQ